MSGRMSAFDLPQSAAPARTDRIAHTKPRSLWAYVRARLLRDPRGVIGLLLVLLFTVLGAIGPFIAPHNPRELNFGQQYRPPVWQARSLTGKTPSPEFVLGTDSSGRDVLSRALYGTRTSMLIGWTTVLLTLLLGLPIGLLSGYASGRLDNFLMRLTDIFYALPTIMFYILIVMALRNTALGKLLSGLVVLILAFTLVGWVQVARLARGSALVLREAPYVDAGRAAGARTVRLLSRHVLPNILGPVLVWVTGAVPRIVTVEAILGYLRIGISPPTDPDAFFALSWGGMFLDGRAAIRSSPWVLLVPTICLGLVSIGFALLGDSLRDALDTKSQRA